MTAGSAPGDGELRLVILGRQGAGKGTQCVRLSRRYGIPHVSTGEIFRAAEGSGSELGAMLAEFLRAGELVPDDIVVGVVAERLSEPDTKSGFILDGFPRTAPQAAALSEILQPNDVDLAIDLSVPTDVVLGRLASRRVCRRCGANYGQGTPPHHDWTCDRCGDQAVARDDDTETGIARRLKLYEEATAPLISWYLERDKLVTIDGQGSPDVVEGRLVRAIERRLGRLAERPKGTT